MTYARLQKYGNGDETMIMMTFLPQQFLVYVQVLEGLAAKCTYEKKLAREKGSPG